MEEEGERDGEARQGHGFARGLRQVDERDEEEEDLELVHVLERHDGVGVEKEKKRGEGREGRGGSQLFLASRQQA